MIRREHGRAIELLGQRDKRGIRKVHRQIVNPIFDDNGVVVLANVRRERVAV